jgi:hypothetical protein
LTHNDASGDTCGAFAHAVSEHDAVRSFVSNVMTYMNTCCLRVFPFLFALLLVGVPTVTVAQDDGGVRVVRSDQQELILTIVPETTVSTLATGEILPSIEGARIANSREPGAPIRFEIRVPVVLPYPSGTSIEVISLDYAEPIAGRIAPVPFLERDASDIPYEQYRANPALYAASTQQTATADLQYIGIARDVHAGLVVVNPALYNAAAGTIRLLRSATVRLRFPAAARSSRVARLSELTRAAFVNSSAATAWALAQPSRGFERRSAVAGARAYMRVDVDSSGLYALTSEDFQRAGIDLASVDASRIAVYGSRPGGLSEERTHIDSSQMRQVPAVVERNGEGRATRVLFYASGPSRWEYRGWDTVPTHRISPFSFAQSYIVAVDGEVTREFPTIGGPASYDVEPTWGISRVFSDEEKVNAIDVRRVGGGSGRDWYGTEFLVDPRDRATDMKPFVMSLPGLERSVPMIYRVRVANAGHDAASGGSTVDGAGTFRFWQQDAALGSTVIPSNDKYSRSIASTKVFTQPDGNSVPADGRSSLKIEFSNRAPASGFLDYYEIHYGRRLVADGNSITFDAPSGNGIARYRVTGFSGDDIVGFDITDPLNPVQLERKSTGEGGVYVFHDQLRPARESRRYLVVERGSARRVKLATKAVFGDLRGRPRNADILVVTHEDLRPSAQKYVDYRNSRGGLRAAYVTTEEIFSEYSSGTFDPTAIRDYIGQAFRTWDVKPQYVILLGDASYDYRNIATTQKQIVPTMQSDDGDSYNENYSTNTDDYFVRITNADELPDLVSGRYPVEGVEQADQMIDKLIRYETTRNFGAWRHTSIMSADDDYPCLEGAGFVGQSEGLIDPNSAGWMEAKKIYLPGYPTEKVPTDRKPGATADLLQHLNRGAVVTNWIGHGNPKQWAHELLLEKDQFIPRIANDSVLTHLVAATCNFGLFDDPGQSSGAEMFFLHPTAGAVSLIGSSRASFIWQNKEMLEKYFPIQFRRDAETKRYPSIGAALLTTKLQPPSDLRNDEKYHIFGDPSMQLNLPENIVTIDSINGRAISSEVVTIGALSVVNVEGSVVDPDGRLLEDFNGTVMVSLFDADRRATAVECAHEFGWQTSGGRLFRGPAQVVNGRFRATFRVPKDIAYDSSAARIHAYAYSGVTDAVGSSRNVRVFGSDVSTVSDTAGPAISIYLDDRSFRSGDVVTPQPLLIVDLSDTSGINSSGSSLGHRIEAWIDGSPNAIDLTDFYQTGVTDYRVGSAERTLLGLAPGEHHVKVRAWDIYNNPRMGEALFRITEGGEANLVVTNVVNYPNPMGRETEFTFQHNQSRPLDVEIAIFTMGGRKVRTLEARSVSDRFVRIPWDGTDSDGAPMANGVYFYRIRVSVPGNEEAGTYESIEKVAIVR